MSPHRVTNHTVLQAKPQHRALDTAAVHAFRRAINDAIQDKQKDVGV